MQLHQLALCTACVALAHTLTGTWSKASTCLSQGQPILEERPGIQRAPCRLRKDLDANLLAGQAADLGLEMIEAQCAASGDPGELQPAQQQEQEKQLNGQDFL